MRVGQFQLGSLCPELGAIPHRLAHEHDSIPTVGLQQSCRHERSGKGSGSYKYKDLRLRQYPGQGFTKLDGLGEITSGVEAQIKHHRARFPLEDDLERIAGAQRRLSRLVRRDVAGLTSCSHSL